VRLLLYLSALLLIAPTRAQDSTRYVLPTVVVTATRQPVPLERSPFSSKVVDAATIEEMGAATVDQVLSAQSTIYIRHYSGGLATLSQRGQSASSTLILLDGHRIASPSLGQLDLSLLPSTLLNAIEITDGPGSASYGRDALGGMIHLHTGHTDNPSLQVQIRTGSFGKRTMNLAASHRRGKMAGRLAAEYDTFTGDYPYLNKGFFPPRTVPLTGAARTRRSLYGSMSYGQWRLATWYSDAERGLPDVHSTLPSQEQQWDKHLRLWAQGTLPFTWGTLRVSGLAQWGALRYQNERIKLDNTGRTLISTITADASFAPHHRWQTSTGLEGGYGRAGHPSLSDDAQEKHGAIFIQGTGDYGALWLYPSLRQDVYLRPGEKSLTALSPRIGANLRLTSRFHAIASFGRAFRVPTFNDRFWVPGGNPLLKPERSWTLEAGLRAQHRFLSSELTVFRSHNKDRIVWSRTDAGYWAPENLLEQTLRGVTTSLSTKVEFAERMTASASVHYTHTTPQARLIPQHQVKGLCTLRFGHLSLYTSIRYTGAQQVSSEDALNAFLIMDNHLRIAWPVNERTLGMGLRVENTLNTYHEFLPSHPMPPRLWRLDVTLTL